MRRKAPIGKCRPTKSPKSCSTFCGTRCAAFRAASRFGRRVRRKSRTLMSVFEKHRDTLEHHETMMGSARGRLAVAMDLLTDSLALVGQHGVYCRSERFPGKPKMDIALVLEQLDDVKQLVQSALEELRPRG